MMKMNSIRFKITAIALAAVLVAMLAVFAASYPSIQAETERSSVEMMRLIGENTKSTLDEYFVSVEQAVNLAANMAVDSLDSVTLVECGAAGSYAKQNERTQEQTERLDAYIAGHCEKVLRTFESAASHTNGIITYYYCINPEISGTQHGFYYSRIGKAGFVEQEPLDAAGFDAEDPGHNVWYATTIKRGRPSWIGLYPYPPMGEMQLCSYVVPIYCADTLIGVLGMDIPLESITDHVSSVRVYETGFASLCDVEGNLLYHPELGRQKLPELEKLSVSGDLLDNDDSGDALIRYTINGQRRQMSFTTLRNDMKLIITAPLREINASWMNLARNIAIITLAVMVILGVIIRLVMRFIISPLLSLTAASQRLADKDYDVKLNYRSKDEIGQLTQAFVRMRDTIKYYIADLTRRANTDMLTGLPNMRCFFKLAKAERQRLSDSGSSAAMLFFDLVGMKYYNRQYGFEEGDRLLCAVGWTLAEHFGEKCICRFSEDHFAAVCDEKNLEEKLTAAFRACKAANNGNSLPMRAGIYRDSIEPVSVSIACDRANTPVISTEAPLSLTGTTLTTTCCTSWTASGIL